MPDNIIAQWLNLPSVKFSEAVTRNGCTEIYLHRDNSSGYICSNCDQISFWGWDSRLVRIRDLSVFEYKTYLNIYKHRTNCPDCGVKIEKLDFVDSYSRCTSRFEALVARLCRITSLKQVAELLELDWKTVNIVDQMKRAAVSIPSNIAEGAARNSQKEFLQFLHVALGSIAELETQLIISKKLGFLNNENIFEDLEKIKSKLLGLIRYLRKRNEK